jgi:hypothetical protein
MKLKPVRKWSFESLFAGGEDVGYNVSESIEYGSDTSIEGFMGVYDSTVEGDEGKTFFLIFRNYFLYFE